MVQLEVSKSQQIILGSITDGVFTVDMNWRITSFNRAAARPSVPWGDALSWPLHGRFMAGHPTDHPS